MFRDGIQNRAREHWGQGQAQPLRRGAPCGCPRMLYGVSKEIDGKNRRRGDYSQNRPIRNMRLRISPLSSASLLLFPWKTHNINHLFQQGRGACGKEGKKERRRHRSLSAWSWDAEECCACRAGILWYIQAETEKIWLRPTPWPPTGEDEIMVILEVKGYESEQDRQKRTAAERWVKAVNYHGGYGKWQLVECKDPRTVDKLLNGLFKS